MPKRKDLLDWIRDFVCEGTELPIETMLMLAIKGGWDILSGLRAHYAVEDVRTGFFHEKIMEALYIDGAFSSFDSASQHFHLHQNTLDDYRKQYNDHANKILERVKKEIEDDRAKRLKQ